MNSTKVIVTIGPNDYDSNKIKELFICGMDVVRLNMSYCSQSFCKKVLNDVKQINKEFSKKLAVLFDIAGPELKIGKIDGDQVTINQGDKIRLYIDEVLGDMTKFSVNYKDLIKDVMINDKIKVNNGSITLDILEKGTNYLLCEVLNTGEIKSGMTFTIPGRKINMPFLNQKDIDDITFASQNHCDFISLSFVSSSEDVLEVSDLLIELNNNHMDILTKVENKDAYDEIDEIIKLSDGIIVARGDLGAAVAIEEVPLMQKEILSKCHREGKISIVSTSFLSSDENNLVPTRAEVSDVSNAVLDGADVIILNDECLNNKHQNEVVKILEKIIHATESSILMNTNKTYPLIAKDVTSSVAYSALTCAENLECVAIVAPTMSGYTAKKLSNLKPNCPIIAISPNLDTAKNLSLYYGVYPVVSPDVKTFDDIIKVARTCVMSMMKVEEKSKIIITGGYPFNNVKHTNFMKIEEL